MKCTKQNSYKTKGEALKAMLRIPQKPSGLVPFRVYWCKDHKAWHMTSKPHYQRRGNVDHG